MSHFVVSTWMGQIPKQDILSNIILGVSVRVFWMILTFNQWI